MTISNVTIYSNRKANDFLFQVVAYNEDEDTSDSVYHTLDLSLYDCYEELFEAFENLLFASLETLEVDYTDDELTALADDYCPAFDFITSTTI